MNPPENSTVFGAPGIEARWTSTAKEGVAATMNMQPTPASIAAAEEKLGDISAKKVKAMKRGMARARVADKAGDLRACRKALATVQRVIGP